MKWMPKTTTNMKILLQLNDTKSPLIKMNKIFIYATCSKTRNGSPRATLLLLCFTLYERVPMRKPKISTSVSPAFSPESMTSSTRVPPRCLKSVLETLIIIRPFRDLVDCAAFCIIGSKKWLVNFCSSHNLQACPSFGSFDSQL